MDPSFPRFLSLLPLGDREPLCVSTSHNNNLCLAEVLFFLTEMRVYQMRVCVYCSPLLRFVGLLSSAAVCPNCAFALLRGHVCL